MVYGGNSGSVIGFVPNAILVSSGTDVTFHFRTQPCNVVFDTHYFDAGSKTYLVLNPDDVPSTSSKDVIRRFQYPAKYTSPFFTYTFTCTLYSKAWKGTVMVAPRVGPPPFP